MSKIRVTLYKDPSRFLIAGSKSEASPKPSGIFKEKVVTHHVKQGNYCINSDCENRLSNYEIDRQCRIPRLTKYDFCRTCRNSPNRIQFIDCKKCSQPFRPEGMRATCDTCKSLPRRKSQ